MGLKYIGFGVDGFTAAPVLLTAPAAGALAAALAARGRTPATGLAYRALAATSVTITDTAGNVTTWVHQAGEGYALPIKDIVCSGAVLVFY